VEKGKQNCIDKSFWNSSVSWYWLDEIKEKMS
jgi:hypothetical protein